MVTIAEIARRAKVSKTAVSLVINEKPGVSKATIEHVRKVMADLNYVPSALAQRFAARKSMCVALIALSYPRVFYDQRHAEMLDAVYSVLEEHGYNLVLGTSSKRFLEENRAIHMLRSGQVDGMLLLEPKLDQQYLYDVAKSGAPVVVVNSDGSDAGLDSFRTDDVAVGRMAAEYLLSLGHRNIGFISGTMEYASVRDRLLGFQTALQEAGVPLGDRRIHYGHYDTSADSGRLGCRTIIENAPDTTAIFCCNATMALTAMATAQEIGRPVPTSLSILGVDDYLINEMSNPPLTSIGQQSDEMATRATELLMERMKDPRAEDEGPRIELFAPRLIVRQSCAPPSADA